MRGHETLQAMRRRNQKPDMVRLELQPYPRKAPKWAIPGDMVFVEPDDTIGRLDLRFLVGCQVMVSGSDAARVRELFGAAQDHGAQRVIGHHIVPAERESFDLLEILDTEGVLTWHA